MPYLMESSMLNAKITMNKTEVALAFTELSF